jgi:hypothetical protein
MSKTKVSGASVGIGACVPRVYCCLFPEPGAMGPSLPSVSPATPELTPLLPPSPSPTLPLPLQTWVPLTPAWVFGSEFPPFSPPASATVAWEVSWEGVPRGPRGLPRRGLGVLPVPPPTFPQPVFTAWVGAVALPVPPAVPCCRVVRSVGVGIPRGTSSLLVVPRTNTLTPPHTLLPSPTLHSLLFFTTPEMTAWRSSPTTRVTVPPLPTWLSLRRVREPTSTHGLPFFLKRLWAPTPLAPPTVPSQAYTHIPPHPRPTPPSPLPCRAPGG